MMIGLLVAGITAILAGLLAIVYGYVLDLSFGNTLIVAGAFGVGSGLIVLAQALVVHELRNLSRKLSPRMASDARARPVGEEGFAPLREVLPQGLGAAMEAEAPPIPNASAPPWREDAPRDRMRQEQMRQEQMRQEPGVAPAMAALPEAVEPAPPPKRRNLMFSSTVRKDRERPLQAGEAADLPEAADAPPASLEDAWPRSDRPLRPSEVMAQRRAARAALADGKPGGAPPGLPREEPPSSAVTVIKSGVVDGMAYSLYSDGSIEAAMPEGMMRFASIDELRAHLDQRQ
jgi:hypothetical protein